MISYQTLDIVISEADRLSAAVLDEFIALQRVYGACNAEIDVRMMLYVDGDVDDNARKLWRVQVRRDRVMRAIDRLIDSHGAALAPITGEARVMPFVTEVM